MDIYCWQSLKQNSWLIFCLISRTCPTLLIFKQKVHFDTFALGFNLLLPNLMGMGGWLMLSAVKVWRVVDWTSHIFNCFWTMEWLTPNNGRIEHHLLYCQNTTIPIDIKLSGSRGKASSWIQVWQQPQTKLAIYMQQQHQWFATAVRLWRPLILNTISLGSS